MLVSTTSPDTSIAAVKSPSSASNAVAPASIYSVILPASMVVVVLPFNVMTGVSVFPGIDFTSAVGAEFSDSVLPR